MNARNIIFTDTVFRDALHTAVSFLGTLSARTINSPFHALFFVPLRSKQNVRDRCTAVGIISDSLVTRCVPARTNTFPSVVTAVRSDTRGSAIVYLAPALAGILEG